MAVRKRSTAWGVLVAGGVVVVGLGVSLGVTRLDDADKWGSVVGGMVAVLGLPIAVWSVLLARRGGEPEGIGDVPRVRVRVPVPDGRHNWPDPATIPGEKAFQTTLRITWMRAGSPSYEEIERQSGGLLTAREAERLLTSDWIGDAEDVRLLLEVCGVPDELNRRWAGVHATVLLAKRRRDQAEYPSIYGRRLVRQLQAAGAALAVGAPLLLLAGSGIGGIVADPGALSAGRWAAFGVSALVVLAASWATIVRVSEYRGARNADAARIPIWPIPLTFLLATVLGAVLAASADGPLAHVGGTVRDILVWRW